MGTDFESEADRQFLSDFEKHSLQEGLDHLGHLRLTWMYLNRYDMQKSSHLLCVGIKSYAESKGAFDKYHATITDAMVRIMAKRVVGLSPLTWETFLHLNNDIAKNWLKVLDKNFSRDKLMSQQARLSVVEPDIKPF